MDCPSCHKMMESGVAQVRGSWAGFFFVGLSLQDLYFDGSKKHAVLGSRETRAAYRCPHCESVLITGREKIRGRFVDPRTGVVEEP